MSQQGAKKRDALLNNASDLPSDHPLLLRCRENAWRKFDALMVRVETSGEVITSMDDEILDDLRSSWDNRLRTLYEF